MRARTTFVAAMVLVLAAGRPVLALAPPPAPPALAGTVITILAVDDSGRRAVVADAFFGANGAHRVDRLTGTVKVLPSLVAVSGDGSAVITSYGSWLDVDTGAATPMPPGTSGARPLLTADGRTYFTMQGTTAAVVDGASGRYELARVAGVPTAVSAHGRFVVIATNCAADIPSGMEVCDQIRWDRVAGSVERVARRTASEFLLSGVADTGRVIVGVRDPAGWSVVARDPGGGARVLGPSPWLGGAGQLSDDGRTFVWTYVPTLCCGSLGAIDVDANVLQLGESGLGLIGWSRTSSSGIQPSSLRLSGDGSTIVFVYETFPSTPGASGDHLLGTFAVPGVAPSPRLRAGEVLPVPMVGREGIGSDASAVVLNVTVTDPVASGFLTVWPCGEARPLASNVNFAAGQTVANAVVVGVGAGGAVCTSSNVALNLVIDAQGWFGPGSAYRPLVPTRLVDSRAGEEDRVANIAAGTELAVPVAGRAGIGADPAAVVLNLTVVNPAAAGFLTVWPCGAPRPLASNLNFTAGQTVANATMVAPGPARSVCAWANVTVDVIVDAQGWFGPGSGLLSAVPVRILDSRHGDTDSSPNLPTGEATLAAGVADEAVVLDVTVTNPSAAGFVTVWPCDEPRPLASSVNFAPGQTVANLVVVGTGTTRRVCTWANVAIDLVVDRQGAFATASSYVPLTPVRLLDTRS